jgi:hypothetical protein
MGEVLLTTIIVVPVFARFAGLVLILPDHNGLVFDGWQATQVVY